MHFRYNTRSTLPTNIQIFFVFVFGVLCALFSFRLHWIVLLVWLAATQSFDLLRLAFIIVIRNNLKEEKKNSNNNKTLHLWYWDEQTKRIVLLLNAHSLLEIVLSLIKKNNINYNEFNIYIQCECASVWPNSRRKKFVKSSGTAQDAQRPFPCQKRCAFPGHNNSFIHWAYQRQRLNEQHRLFHSIFSVRCLFIYLFTQNSVRL